MSLANPLTNTFWRLAVALVGATAAFIATSTDATTAGARPLFQMPVPCGQTWEASTYAEHWNGDQDAIDLAQRDGLGNNISEGEPALAAAAGTVLKAYTNGNGEHRVFLDHGNGWRTDYVHLESVPPLTVGQHIAQGEMVGRISNSGKQPVAMHLHYNQMEDGSPSRASFDGKLIDTYAGNLDSWGTWGTDDAEELTSVNCPQNSFVPFNQNGMRYMLLYKPSSGLVKIQRLDADAKGTTNVWGGYWTQRITNLVPFTLSGGQQHVFSYQASTGKIRFDRINSQAEGTTTLSTGTWWKGWTHVTPFSLGGKPYLLVYDSLHGYANVERVNAEGSGTTNVSKSTWTKGWTHFMPYELGGVQYMLLYKGGTGQVKVEKLTGSGNNVSISEVYASTWSTGWTQLVPLKHNGTVRLFAYRGTTGEVSYGKLKSGGQGSQHLASGTWTTTWTAFTPFLQDGDGAMLIYKGGIGTVQTRRLNDAGTGSDALWTDTWTTGWA